MASAKSAGPGAVSSVAVSGGWTLNTQTWMPQGACVGVVMFVHGWLECVDTKIARRFAKALLAKGIALISYDSVMHGKSMGPYPWCLCAGNPADVLTMATHCTDMVRAVALPLCKQAGVPFVLTGHSMGGGTAMSATESVAKACAADGVRFAGAIYLAPGNNADMSESLRWCLCPCWWPMSKCWCICLPGESDVTAVDEPGEPNWGAPLCHVNGCCRFGLPTSWGGFMGTEAWAKHHANVPYHIIVGTADDVCKLPEQVLMQAAAPHGSLERLPGVGHDIFSDKEARALEWVELTAQKVLEYIQAPASSGLAGYGAAGSA